MAYEFDDGFVVDDLYVEQVSISSPLVRSVGESSGKVSSSGMIKGEFLRGPIPRSWLSRACALPGKATATALAIWFLSGLRGRTDNLKLTSGILARFHVDRSAKSRALKALEEAGLISVKREARKNPVVT